MDNRYYRHNRRKYSLKVHIVLVTKYRKQLLQGSIADDVKQKILDIANTRGYEIIAMETDKDHIHFLLSYDTTDRVCDIVKIVKQETTYYLWQKYNSVLSKQYWKKKIFVQWMKFWKLQMILIILIFILLLTQLQMIKIAIICWKDICSLILMISIPVKIQQM